jgi:hypothetical protein
MPVVKLLAVCVPTAFLLVVIGPGAVNFVGPGSVCVSFARRGYPAGWMTKKPLVY